MTLGHQSSVSIAQIPVTSLPPYHTLLLYLHEPDQLLFHEVVLHYHVGSKDILSFSNPAVNIAIIRVCRFAELTAAIFEQAGVAVNLFGRVCPTPFVPFTVTSCKHVVGVMVTASHNPKEDNGYKVYGHLGTQVMLLAVNYLPH